MNGRKTILTCVALSPRAAAVAAEGLRVARLLDARPAFLHVGSDTAATREALAKVLREAAAGDAEPDAEPLLIREGRPNSVIARAAAELKANMIVLGALRRDPLLVGLWGSVARRVARRSACSVLLLSDPRPHRPTGDVVVASVRMDALSRPMVELVLEMAGRGGVESAHFVREFPVNEAHWAVGGTTRRPATVDDYISTQLATERAALADFLSDFDLRDVPVRATSLAGREGTEILDYARDLHADLLVMPAPARRMGLLNRFFQHPAELAMRRLSCALLLFRSRT